MALMHPVVNDSSAAGALKVLLVDDRPLPGVGVRHMLEHAEDVEVVGESHEVAELAALVERCHPDAVVVDLIMPGTRIVEMIERVHTRHPEVTIVVLSGCAERGMIDAALAAGAGAYVLRGARPVDLASVLRTAVSGAVFLAPAPAPPGPVAGPSPGRSGLTQREQSILKAITSGMTTSAISRELWISEHTIKFHLTNIYRKLRVSNRASAIRYALEHGLV